jgi:hypothetical protein
MGNGKWKIHPCSAENQLIPVRIQLFLGPGLVL